ncbi:MAG: RpiB/LacA/LacB family sugar-phosphate isomerase, partial [Bacteroidales bacterium]|nr:RpiB/LacA/LacB family sugar-phosphate isomerase [Bacteroidales bacterium]
MTIGICSDHAGYEYKSELIKYLAHRGHNVIDYG